MSIDLHDVQGNIVKGYGRYGYPVARYLLATINSDTQGREFLSAILPMISTAEAWQSSDGPDATTNIGMTYQGLKALEVPELTLRGFPPEFAMGMKKRFEILGDVGSSGHDKWDDAWSKEDDVHLWISINSRDGDKLVERYDEIVVLAKACNVTVIPGHKSEGAGALPYQDAGALQKEGKITKKEHFGYDDGISDPYFKGSGTGEERVIGGGKCNDGDPLSKDSWSPLETGEFILGYKDEAYEYPMAPEPKVFSKNGTFMAYRKLHQNVGSFNRYLKDNANLVEGGEEEVAAIFAGRWRDGAPLTSYPSYTKWRKFGEDLEKADPEEEKELRKTLVAFNYDNDNEGASCPIGSHIRRVNPRGALGYNKDAFESKSALTNRRRLARRGLPYGTVSDSESNDGEHGIIFMAICASLNRQFEFVQQQWVNYGNDLKLGNDKDPLIGSAAPEGTGVMTVPAGEHDEKPLFLQNIPRFVDVRGGAYFFIPSITALKLMAKGIVDPT